LILRRTKIEYGAANAALSNAVTVVSAVDACCVSVIGPDGQPLAEVHREPAVFLFLVRLCLSAGSTVRR
jgi:hypothetical protein